MNKLLKHISCFIIDFSFRYPIFLIYRTVDSGGYTHTLNINQIVMQDGRVLPSAYQ